MPSTRVPSSVVTVGRGATPPGGGAAASLEDALVAHITDPVGAHASSAISTPTAASAWGPFPLDSIEVEGQLAELLDDVNAPCHTIVVDGGTSPYTLDSNLADTYIPQVLVDTSAARTITLPQTPADHKGKTWIIRDTFGAGVTYPFTVQRWPASTYYVNGLSGPSWKQYDAYTTWLVFCDGTGFFMQALPNYVGKSHFTVTSYALHPLGYTLDQYGERDEKILVTTVATPTSSPIINLPDPSLIAFNAGRELFIVDIAGYSEADNIILRVPGGVLLNGVSQDYYLAQNRGQWRLVTNGTAWFVDEIPPPRSAPYLHNSTPYTLDSRAANRYRDDIILVDTSAARTITLPQYPARNNGRRWRVFDVTGGSVEYPIIIARFGGATYAVNGNTGDTSVQGNYSQWEITCDGTDYYIQQLDTPPGPPVIVTGVNTPYTLDSSGRRDDHVYVDTTATGRTIVLPANPALFEGRLWRVYDQDGNGGGANFITLTRGGAYSINGVAADTTLRGGYGQWVIVCDGHNFYVHPIRLEGQGAQTTVSTATYTVDANGYRDEILFVATASVAPVITLPNPGSPGQAGRRLRIIDASGNSETNNISLHAPGPSVKINGVALVDVDLSANFGQWVAVCNAANWFVA